MTHRHTFHIPVMGIGYTVDTPVKVSHLGINSVISLVDDELMEKLRAMYCHDYGFEYQPILSSDSNARASRIRLYLNLVHDICHLRFNDLIHLRTPEELEKYFNLLPTDSKLPDQWMQFLNDKPSDEEKTKWLKAHLSMGSIDVNIMTKIDKENYDSDEQVMEPRFNDAQAALRGFAESKLCSSLVYSAGMNPAIYGYTEQFDDFYADAQGFIRKKLTIKVSDFRSALIQGKYFAKKGIWVSEYRIESGLNCGGHAFATDGLMMGPIMAEFRDRREELYNNVYELFIQGAKLKNKAVPQIRMPLTISAQGGIGTHREHEFVRKHFQVDSIGWGSPFLLVPEVTAIDDETVELLAAAGEDSLYLSYISPMGVAFNNVRNNTKDIEKEGRISRGVPGSPCTKTYISFNKEFTKVGICMASRLYQKKKIEELDARNLSTEEYNAAYRTIVNRACICVGLGTAALLKYKLDTQPGGDGVSVCPGPNLAYFSRKMTLLELTDHIYGRMQLIQKDRPHFLMKELSLYLDYITQRVKEKTEGHAVVSDAYIKTFVSNMIKGIEFYRALFCESNGFHPQEVAQIHLGLDAATTQLNELLPGA